MRDVPRPESKRAGRQYNRVEYNKDTKLRISPYLMNRLLSEDIAMTLMRVRRAAQLKLPADARQALNVKEGDYLEAHITKDGLLLTPVQVVERARAWKNIEDIAARVRNLEPDPNEDPMAAEEGSPRRSGTSAANISKAVFDTTILVSALLNFVTGGASHDLLRFAAEGTFELYLSDDILEETARVLLTGERIRKH
jgi:bifunctional DNA-binding transcriptional regulator/antitoxin component of YhaV-PrlF toxin-antitoxin module